jgi:hypothetical protein
MQRGATKSHRGNLTKPHQNISQKILKTKKKSPKLTQTRTHTTTTQNTTQLSQSFTSTTIPLNENNPQQSSRRKSALPIPAINLSTAKAIPIHYREDPASLEYSHFSNPKWSKPTPNRFLHQADPFQTMLQHPVGQVLISQWIGNHISLHLQHVLKQQQSQIKTKNKKSILVGYDMNSEYVKDVGGLPISDIPEDDPRHPQNKTKLLFSPQKMNLDWNDVPMSDYGYIFFDPNKHSYIRLKEKYDEELQGHLKWAQLCGVSLEESLAQELKHREEFKNNDQIDPMLLIGDQNQQKPPQETDQNSQNVKNNHNEDDLSKFKFTQMTLPQQASYVSKIISKALIGTSLLIYTIIARTTQILTPGGAKTLWNRYTSHITKRFIADKFYSLFRTISIAGIRSIQAVYNKIDHALQSRVPFITRLLKKRVHNISDKIIAVGSPVLGTIHGQVGTVNRVAKNIDEWFGTEYSTHPALNKLKKSTKFEILLELSPHPGNPPIPPKPSPYQDTMSPEMMFKTIQPDHKGSTMEDLLHAAEIDEHRLLLSYIHKLRSTSEISIGLCPDEITPPKDFFKPKINDKGMLEVPPTQLPPTGELMLMLTDADTVYEQAGLRKHPDIWLSKRILDKIPGPDLGDLSRAIQKIDPNFRIKLPSNYSSKKTSKGDQNDAQKDEKSGFFSEIFTGVAFGFVGGSVAYESYQIYQELQSAFQQFPDTPKAQLIQDYSKFYGLRMKYSTTALLDAAYYNITNSHLFDIYKDNNDVGVEQQRQRRQFNEEELAELLRQVEMQIQNDTQTDGSQPEFTILSTDQADALMQLNKMKNQQDLLQQHQVLALSQNHPSNIPHYTSEQFGGGGVGIGSGNAPLHFQPLSPDEIEQIERQDPNLVAQVNHSFGISKDDLIQMELTTQEMSQNYENSK